MKKILLPLIALMLTAANDAFAEKYSVSMTSEFNSVPTIYAGTQNQLTVTVTNSSENAGSNIAVSVYQGEELIGTETIDNLPAGDRITCVFDDPTIRPITEKTVNGNDNQNISYKVVLSDGVENTEKDFSFVVLYNGNLGKDYAYPTANPTKRNFSFTGEVQVMVSEEDAYCTASTTSREENWTVDLSGENVLVHKALLYVSYNWDNNADGDFNTWTTTFNGYAVTPLASYRDQTNLGNYGSYGYGLVVYDVTEAVVDGSNTFKMERNNKGAAIYPRPQAITTT
ncbi:MAG: DUF3344 domain-containing protein [Bacteroidales bacterium]|nr:DUF3344 domain-containing protein [Bacteroidales bacterium]